MNTSTLSGASDGRTLPRDVFMYLLVIVVLTMSAISFGRLLFAFVDLYLPDVAMDVCQYGSCTSSIRWALSMLVIAFPILLWAWRFIQGDIAKYPAKAELRVRKWLMYLTLFVAGVVVIGDGITLIYNWLQGELTTQFMLKILSVLFIAGSIFYYFLRELHAEKRGRQGIVAGVVILLAACSIGVGFWSAGLPASARDRRLDDTRASNLQGIQSEIVNFWTAKVRLPETLDELRDPISGFVAPTDPETRQTYEYIRTGSLSFMLCATFKTASQNTGTVAPQKYPSLSDTDNWSHDAGRVCFDRRIDPQRYPPKNQN